MRFLNREYWFITNVICEICKNLWVKGAITPHLLPSFKDSDDLFLSRAKLVSLTDSQDGTIGFQQRESSRHIKLLLIFTKQVILTQA